MHHKHASFNAHEYIYMKYAWKRLQRTVGTLDFGEWDLVGAVVSGKKPRLQRYLTFLLEKGILDLLKAQRDSAKPITRGTIIIDGDGGNIRNLCPAC